MTSHSEHIDLAKMLAWYGAMGVTAPVAGESSDWTVPGRTIAPEGQFLSHTTAPVRVERGHRDASSQGTLDAPPKRTSPERPAATAQPTPPANRSGSAPAHEASGDEAGSIAQAAQLARSAATLDELEAALGGFDGCPLKRTAKNLCFRRGADQAPLMIIGEGPGRDEDRTGQPFVGRAGQLLDRMLAAIGRSEATSHITNVVYWRPPGNRTPTDFETMVCRPFLARQIELVDPGVILLLGGSSAKAILGTSAGIMRTRGKWHDLELGGRSRRVVATLHPAYLLRVPTAKCQAWEDLLAVDDELRKLED